MRKPVRHADRYRHHTLGLVLGLSGLVTSAVLSPAAAHAQVLYGTITGSVADRNGANIPGAHVLVHNVDTGQDKTVDTNDAGEYAASNLTPGTYRLTISATGFGNFTQEGATVSANQAIRVNASLAVGGANEVVTVTGAPPALQTEDGSSNYNISTEQVAQLPTASSSGRNVQSLFKLVPGATPPFEANSTAANPNRSQPINVNGNSYDNNTQRIDGAVDTNPWLPDLVAYLPSPDAIESVNIVTAAFNAEQGSAGGAAVNYTVKSGTNKFHGAVWAYNTNSAFAARGYTVSRASTPRLPKNILNEDGGRLGGPIFKDKLFFFADYNRSSSRATSYGNFTVPTALMRQGDFSEVLAATSGVTRTIIYDPATGTASGTNRTPFVGNKINPARISPAAAKLLANLPLPNSSLGGNPYASNYFTSAVVAFDRTTTDVKLNYVPTDRTTYFGRYSIAPNTITDPQIFGSFPGGQAIDGNQPGTATGRIQNIGLGTTHTFSPRFAIDINGGVTRMRVGAQSNDLSLGDAGTSTLGIPGTNLNGQTLYGGLPAFTFDTYSSLGNPNTASPFLFRDMVYTGTGNATYVLGAHSIRFGGEYLHAMLNHLQAGSAIGTSANPRGSFGFTGGITSLNGGAASDQYNALADFLLGQAATYNKAVQAENPLTLRFSNFALYVQDTWTVNHLLTLNYGVRYEFYGLPYSDKYGTTRLDTANLTSVTDIYGTHQVPTVLVGGQNGVPNSAGISNGWGMFVPRFGIDFRADERTVIRGGFGMTVDPNSLRSVLNQYPSDVTTSLSGANGYVAATNLNSNANSTATQVGIPTLNVPSFSQGRLPLPGNISTYTIPQSFRRGYIYSYDVALQHQFPASMVANIAYVGSNAVRQQTLLDINAAPAGGGNAGRLLNQAHGPNTNNTSIDATQPFRGTSYNSLQSQLTHTGSKILDFGLIYTWSKAINSEDQTQNGVLFNYPDYWDRDRAVASTDRTNNLQIWTIAHSPFGKGRTFLTHGIAGVILGGWDLNTTLSRTSGTPFNVTASSTSLNAPGNTQVADQITGVPTIRKTGTNGFRQYLNPAAYQNVTAVRLGTSARDGVRGPGFFDLDAGLHREIPLYRSLKMLVQAESFNVTNTPSFSNPVASVTSSNFGAITGTSSASRSIRLSGRVEF